MHYNHVAIEAVAYEVPPTVVTSASLERMLGRGASKLGLAKGFLEALTGIESRRFWPTGTMPSDAATLAAEKCLARTAIPRSRLGVLVNTSVCRDHLEPSTASTVHGNLGLGRGCANYDVGNACLGFLTGMQSVANMIELGQIEAGMVVAGEGSRPVIQNTLRELSKPGLDFQRLRDHLATLTLGSGAVAMMLVHEKYANRPHRLLGGVNRAATQHNHLCVGDETGMITKPAELLKAGVDVASQTWELLLEEVQMPPERFTEFTMHQVGKANYDALCDALGLPRERALQVYPEFGNIGAASVPLALAKAVETGRVAVGDVVALLGIGSGLNCSMMAVQW